MTSTSHAERARQFHDKMDHLQFGQSFDEARFLIVSQEPHGFGGQVSRRMLGLQLGYILDRTVVFRLPNDPPYVTCYRPFSRFTYQDIADLPAPTASFEVEQRDKVVQFDFQAFWNNQRIRRWFYPWVPPEFSSSKCGRLVFDGETLTRFYLLNEFSQHVEAAKARIGFEHPIVGLHVRRGDKEVETPFVPLPVLMERVEAIRERSGVNRVFVTSDSDEVFDELPQGRGFEYIYDREEKRYNNASHLFLEAHPEFQEQETYTAVKVFELLSACDWIVGQDNAHFARLAAARIGARLSRCDRHSLVLGHHAATLSGASIRKWPKVLLYEMPRRSQAGQWFMDVSRPLRRRLGIRRRSVPDESAGR
jgi:hypothetical protein